MPAPTATAIALVHACSVRIALRNDGSAAGGIEAALLQLLQRLPRSSVVRVHSHAHERIAAFLDATARHADGAGRGLCGGGEAAALAAKIQGAMQVIAGTLDEFSANGSCLSFNGGKDCTVLLFLLDAVLQQRMLQTHTSGGAGDGNAAPDALRDPLNCVFVAPRDAFADVEAFVEESVLRYHLSLLRVPWPMKSGLQRLQEMAPAIRAVFIGTRQGDPHASELRVTLPTDADWPPFVRVHPILDWKYADVWLFLRLFEAPYCPLYDHGYTSLGSLNNTHPNPALRDGTDPDHYRPAYTLTDATLERVGRD